MNDCPFCGEVIDEHEDVLPRLYEQNGVLMEAHRECLLRNVMGGIGHLRDHAYWCLQMKDPDGGHTYRESALLVDQWVQERGV